jgi:hypothetical protein
VGGGGRGAGGEGGGGGAPPPGGGGDRVRFLMEIGAHRCDFATMFPRGRAKSPAPQGIEFHRRL